MSVYRLGGDEIDLSYCHDHYGHFLHSTRANALGAD
jgi:hypothetical protein